MLHVGFDMTVSGRATTGVGVYARELVTALRARRSVDILAWQHPLMARRGAITRIVNGASLAVWYSHGLKRKAERENIDVCHVTTSLGPWRVRRPMVMTIHDATLMTMPLRRNFADRLFRRAFTIRAARQADAILTPTIISRDEVSAEYGIHADRIRVVPLGVAPAFRHITAPAVQTVRSRYSLESPYVLHVGATPPRKNVCRLIEAFAGLPSHLRDVRLVLAGPQAASDGQSIDLIERFHLHGHVQRLGHVPREDLPALYAGAACLATVSLCEGFGLPAVEAMAAGAPIVASNCSAMPEVTGGAALLVDPYSVSDIADGLRRVLDDAALADDLRHRGRIRSRAFDWALTADLTERVYHDVAG